METLSKLVYSPSEAHSGYSHCTSVRDPQQSIMYEDNIQSINFDSPKIQGEIKS